MSVPGGKGKKRKDGEAQAVQCSAVPGMVRYLGNVTVFRPQVSGSF